MLKKLLYKSDVNKYFFSEVEDKEIFCPWGCYGEGIFVTSKTKLTISYFIHVLFIFYSLYTFCFILFDIYTQLPNLILLYLYFFLIITPVPIYVTAIRIFMINKEVFIIPYEQRIRNKSFLALLVIIAIAYCGGYLGLVSNGVYLPVAMLLIAGSLYSFYILAKVYVNCGHYFTSQ